MLPFMRSVPIRANLRGVINKYFMNNSLSKVSELQRPRGCRAGRHKKRPISSMVSNRFPACTATSTSRTVNTNNLIYVPRTTSNTKKDAGIRFALWNARSMRKKNKSTAFCDFVITERLDCLAFTETWLRGDTRDNRVLADMERTLPNFKFHHIHRVHKKGGGVGVLVRDGLQVRMKEQYEFQSMECMNLQISSASTSLELVVIYRPPPSTKNKLTSNLFFSELSSLLETVCVTSSNIVMAGDFNIHVDDDEDHDASVFLETLDLHDLKQHVNKPTHKRNHTLDLLISRKDSNLVTNPSVVGGLPSDHFAVKCILNIARPGPSVKRVICRSLRKIKTEDFNNDIKTSMDALSKVNDMDVLANRFRDALAKTLNDHAPLTERSIILRPHAPWYTDSLRAEKQERRRRERKWQKTGLTVDKHSYQEQCDNYNNLLAKTKTDYHSNEVAESCQRDLFRVVDKLCSPKVTKSLPAHENPKDLANSFVKFFSDKITRLRNSLDSTQSQPLTVTQNECCSSSLREFRVVSEEDVMKAITSASITSCPLDPLPVDLFKQCLGDTLPTITRIVNLSLSSGTFPEHCKHARIVPLLKKSGADTDELSNYRPISNLSFIGKVIERVAVNQLQNYLSMNCLHAPMQSAYRPYHSVETALLRMQNDVLAALDIRKEAILVLLDFSAAFDCLDHEKLLNRLASRYGIRDKVHQWLTSYLSGRTQSVAINDVSSDPVELKCGVPQGSVAGPLLFILFSGPLQDIIASHKIQCIVYADDTQLLTTFYPKDRNTAVSKMEACIADIKGWCVQNDLVLNDGKTEMIYFSSKFGESSSWSPELKIGGSVIKPSSHARNLGATMDSSMTMSQHVNNVCRGALAGIRKIGQIRHYLNQDSTARLVHAFVTSKLDACNSLLFNLPDRDIAKIQHVQNTAARLVLRASRRQHITPLLEHLHWLPIKQRTAYKILLLVFKALCGLAPTYIADLIHVHVPSRSLRSSSQRRLVVPRTRTKFYGDRTFVFAAAELWNELPNNIRESESVASFKSRLKTYYFKTYFYYDD